MLIVDARGEFEEQRRVYEDRAELYDLIYRGKDYAAEAEVVRDLLARNGVGEGADVVEAACGTGSYLLHLQHIYRVRGFDVSPAMLKLARQKLGEAVELFTADMRTFSLDEPCDGIVCLFSSIGYLPDVAALEEAATAFWRALRPGGVLLIDPWVEPEAWREGHAFAQAERDEESGLQACRAVVSRSQGARSILDFHWLVAVPHQGVEHFTERHVLTMFSRETFREVLTGAGFECELLEEALRPGRRFIACRKPPKR